MIGKWTGNAVEDKFEIGRLVAEIERLKAEKDELVSMFLAKAKRLEVELRSMKAENESLAAHQCQYPAGDEFGNAYCTEINKLREALGSADEQGVIQLVKERDKLKVENEELEEKLNATKEAVTEGARDFNEANQKLRRVLEEIRHRARFSTENDLASGIISMVDEVLKDSLKHTHWSIDTSKLWIYKEGKLEAAEDPISRWLCCGGERVEEHGDYCPSCS